MTPTQAQIEALQTIKKLRDDLPGTNHTDYDAGYNRAMEVCGDIAETALTAAAGVPEQEHIPQQREQKPGLLPSGNTAAEVGAQNREKRIALNAVLEQIEAATIERCAQVVKNYTMKSSAESREQTIDNLVAAIRALKNEP